MIHYIYYILAYLLKSVAKLRTNSHANLGALGTNSSALTCHRGDPS